MLNEYFDKFIYVGEVKFKGHNFYLLNIPFLIIPNEILVKISASNDDSFNKKLYSLVKKSIEESFIDQLQVKPKLQGKNLIAFVHEFFSFSGWGKINVVQIDEKEKRGIVIVSNSPIAKALQGKSTHPVDHILRGILAGLFSDALEEELDCLELKCTATGTAECEFVIKPVHEFDFSKELVQKQLELK